MGSFRAQRRLTGMLLGLAALAALPAAAQPLLSRVERTRVISPTRLVTALHGLEYDLIDALRAGDQPTLDRLLTAEFEQRNAATPQQPVPRAEWLQGTALKAPGAVRIVDMAVHDRGELAIASFRIALEGPRQLLFVVDVWRRSGESFELLTRYASELPPPAALPAPRPDGKR